MKVKRRKQSRKLTQLEVQRHAAHCPSASSWGDVYALYEYARSTNPKAILEVGTYLGRSAIPLGLAMDSGKLVLTDSWEPYPTLKSIAPWREDPWTDIQKNLAMFRMQASPVRLRLVRGKNDDPVTVAAVRKHSKEYDFIFIDGDHSYEGLSADIENYLPMLAANGKAAFHDYMLLKPVTRAIDDHVLASGEWKILDKGTNTLVVGRS